MQTWFWSVVGSGVLSALCAAQVHVELPFRVGNELGEALTLVVGVDERATDRIDTLLGERELPPIHPPQDIFHAVLRFYDSVDGEWKWTYRDFRPPRSTDTFSLEYRLFVQRGRGRTLILRWSYPLPEAIDSAVLSDRVTGSLVRIRFDTAQEGTVTNEFLEEFSLRVWYRRPIAVEERFQEGNGTPEGRTVWLYDLLGRLCWQGNRLPYPGELKRAAGIYFGLERWQGRWRRFLWQQP